MSCLITASCVLFLLICDSTQFAGVTVPYNSFRSYLMIVYLLNIVQHKLPLYILLLLAVNVRFSSWTCVGSFAVGFSFTTRLTGSTRLAEQWHQLLDRNVTAQCSVLADMVLSLDNDQGKRFSRYSQDHISEENLCWLVEWLFAGLMPFLSLSRQCQSTEGSKKRQS